VIKAAVELDRLKDLRVVAQPVACRRARRI
jgi:hypothetical protein